jgi:2-beta-glucuronyltransferase
VNAINRQILDLIISPPRRSKTPTRYLIITAHHDYRTPRRSSIHFIADELAKRGAVRFFSLRYSVLSRHKHDIRSIIDGRANRVEQHDGVECFLWKTPIHPFNMRSKLLRPLENTIFWLYEHLPSRVLVDWATQADVIIYESGIAPIYFELAKELNPTAKHIYRGSDDLATINAAGYALERLTQVAKKMDALCLLSKQMAENIASTGNVYHVPNGLAEDLDTLGDHSPYGAGVHAVSIGSMLFDPEFFAVTSHAFPEVTFHVIGSGHPRQPGYGKNVVVYGDMKYAETICYIKHADIGIAPYISDDVPVYLADSSLKMLQYDFFALPTVCPHSVTGDYRSWFGYTPGKSESIISATMAALAAPHQRSRKILNWAEVTDHLLDPSNFTDARI